MGKSWSWVIKISESHGKHTRNLFWKLGVHWANLGVDMRKFWICSYFCPNQVWSYFSWKFAEYHSWLTLYQKLNHFEPISGQMPVFTSYLGKNWSNWWTICMKLYFYTFDTIINKHSKSQDDWAKIGVNVKIIIFASIFAQNCYFL